MTETSRVAPGADREEEYSVPPAVREFWRQAPVREVTTEDGEEAWLVTGMAEVQAVLSDPRFSRAEAHRRGSGTGRAVVFRRPGIHDLDPPEHTRLRQVLASAFSVRRIRGMRPRIEQITGELLARMREIGPPADLSAALCFPLPVAVVCEILGVPYEDQQRFRRWSELITSTNAYPRERALQARQELTEYISDLASDKSRCPEDSLLWDMIIARDEQGRLTQEEVVRIVFGVLIAGHETTANMLGKGLVAMFDHAEQFVALRADPSLVPAAVDEVLRYVVLSPSTDPHEGLHLVTKCAVELGGHTIPAQSVVLVSPTAANLDARVFPEPDRFDLRRTDADDHVAFGHGPHRCVGAQLARLELEVAYTALLREFPGLRLDVPVGALTYTSGMLIKGLRALPVTWDREVAPHPGYHR
ncbi:cytochrome P450 [Nocardia sp. NEAU-G5]|uniref:Cytochrome P450 n=1 Tax=Nocardia albiluteola TaxID=2842303 RepID=A0ABS6BFF1_9NOCA|nr:cytochrome P450 [Nocardia albiluteola]MBU3068170.1 cytochrome P450 [Nocardia albiluteola]